MWRMADGLTVLSFFFHILVGLFAQERTFRFWTAAATDATTRDGHGEKRRQSAGGLCTAPLALSAFATSSRLFFFFLRGFALSTLWRPVPCLIVWRIRRQILPSWVCSACACHAFRCFVLSVISLVAFVCPKSDPPPPPCFFFAQFKDEDHPKAAASPQRPARVLVVRVLSAQDRTGIALCCCLLVHANSPLGCGEPV